MSNNPFAKKLRDRQLETAIQTDISDLSDVEFAEIVETPVAKPKVWQSLLGLVFGDGVAHLPAVPLSAPQRISKRRMRRLRGRAKEERRFTDGAAA